MITQSKILVSFSVLLLTTQLSASEPIAATKQKEHKQKPLHKKKDSQDVIITDKELKGHADAVTALAIANGTLFSSSADATIKQWDLATGTCEATFEGPTKPVRAIAVPPKATHIVSGADDGAHLWDFSTKTCITLLKDPISAVAYHPKKNILGFGLKSGAIKLATIHNNQAKILATVKKAHAKPVTALTWDPEQGSLLISGSDSLKLWNTPDVNDIDLLAEIATLKGKITSAAISPDGSQLAATANNGNACVWRLTNIQNPKPVRSFDKLDAPQAVRWSPNGSRYAIAQKNGIVTIITKDSTIPQQQEHVAETRALVWYGNALITGSSTGRIQIKNTSTSTKDLAQDKEEQSGNS